MGSQGLNFVTNLHSHQSIVDQDLFGEEVGANCRLVACAELLVDLFELYEYANIRQGSVQVRSKGRSYILVHQAGLAYPTVSQDNDLRLSTAALVTHT